VREVPWKPHRKLVYSSHLLKPSVQISALGFLVCFNPTRRSFLHPIHVGYIVLFQDELGPLDRDDNSWLRGPWALLPFPVEQSRVTA
jgi:hypothetical protein